MHSHRGSFDMKRILGLLVALAVMWWLWSGYATGLLLSFGLLSCLLVVWLSHRMQLTDHESIPLHRLHRIAFYWLWLAGQILKSNIQVTRQIITQDIHPATRKLPTTQQTDQGRVTYANSITLTPGTLSYEVESDVIHVHALHRSSFKDLAKGVMDSKVNNVEERN